MTNKYRDISTPLSNDENVSKGTKKSTTWRTAKSSAVTPASVHPTICGSRWTLHPLG